MSSDVSPFELLLLEASKAEASKRYLSEQADTSDHKVAALVAERDELKRSFDDLQKQVSDGRKQAGMRTRIRNVCVKLSVAEAEQQLARDELDEYVLWSDGLFFAMERVHKRLDPFIQSTVPDRTKRLAVYERLNDRKAEDHERVAKRDIDKICQTALSKPSTSTSGKFAKLRTWAEYNLAGKQLRLINLIIDAGGRISLADLEVPMGWDLGSKLRTPNAWNSMRRELNKKLKRFSPLVALSRREGYAVLRGMGQE